MLEWQMDLGASSVSTPLVTDGFIAAGHEVGLAIVELNGTLRCVFDAHGEVISAPKTDGRRIFFGSTNYIFYAIGTDCKEVWKFPARDRIKSDPLVANGMVYLSSYDGHVYALNAVDGHQVWAFPDRTPKASEPAPAPAPAPAAGKKKKKRGKKAAEPAPPPPAEPKKPKVPDDVADFSYSSPTLHNGVIYLGNLDGRLYALDAKTGEMQWYFKTDGPVTSTPKVEGDFVFFGSNDGNLYCVDLRTLRMRWKVTTKDWVNSSPTIIDGMVYIGSNDRHIYAVDAVTGEVQWSYQTVGPAIAIPAIYQNLVFAAGGSGDGAIYALQSADGTLFWRYETGGKIQSDPVIVGDRMYVTSTDRQLYAFAIKKTKAE